jgi:hypothetical protein
MTTRFLISLLVVGITLYGQIPEWNGERRTFVNPLRILPWPKNAEEAARVSRDDVVDFILALDIPSFTSASDMEQFQFVSLASGKMHLVAVIQGGGTIGANLILIAHCDLRQCTDDSLGSLPPIELSDLLVSVREDGVKQVLTTRERLLGPDSALGVYELFELGPNGPEDVTKKYGAWMRKWLNTKKTEAVRAAANKAEREYFRAVGDYVLAELDLRVEGSADALLKLAVQWSRSASQEIQELAVSAVEEAPESELREQLREQLRRSVKDNKHLLDRLNMTREIK